MCAGGGAAVEQRQQLISRAQLVKAPKRRADRGTGGRLERDGARFAVVERRVELCQAPKQLAIPGRLQRPSRRAEPLDLSGVETGPPAPSAPSACRDRHG
jgi:hypothetical protein